MLPFGVSLSDDSRSIIYNYNMLIIKTTDYWTGGGQGAQYLMGETLKVVWAKFSTLS